MLRKRLKMQINRLRIASRKRPAETSRWSARKNIRHRSLNQSLHPLRRSLFIQTRQPRSLHSRRNRRHQQRRSKSSRRMVQSLRLRLHRKWNPAHPPYQRVQLAPHRRIPRLNAEHHVFQSNQLSHRKAHHRVHRRNPRPGRAHRLQHLSRQSPARMHHNLPAQFSPAPRRNLFPQPQRWPYPERKSRSSGHSAAPAATPARPLPAAPNQQPAKRQSATRPSSPPQSPQRLNHSSPQNGCYRKKRITESNGCPQRRPPTSQKS